MFANHNNRVAEPQGTIGGVGGGSQIGGHCLNLECAERLQVASIPG